MTKNKKGYNNNITIKERRLNEPKRSHQKMKKNGKMTIVPDNKDLPVKTLKKIEEQTGEKIRK